MSVFKVKLNQGRQGNLDAVTPSIQRTVFITGPNNINRKLNDGDTFTDSNYYKRFTYPYVSLEDAFLEVVTDDGSVYSDVPSENTFPLVESLTITAGTTYTDSGNSIDILTDFGSFANFVQIENLTAQAILVKLNGLSTAIFTLGASETQVFNKDDLQVTKIEFDNSASGASDVDVQVIMSIRSVSNS